MPPSGPPLLVVHGATTYRPWAISHASATCAGVIPTTEVAWRTAPTARGITVCLMLFCG